MTQPIYVKYKHYSGFQVSGVRPFFPDEVEDSHIERAVWLTAQIETPGGWGSVQNYDGVGMSAGILHNIAVYRNGNQGDLWKLLWRIKRAVPSLREMEEFEKRLSDRGWCLRFNGLCGKNGALVPGVAIVTELSGPKGNVATQSDKTRAREWAMAFHHLFAHPHTYETQKDFAASWLLNSQSKLEEQAYDTMAPTKKGHEDAASMTMRTIGEAEDLAMCVYHSFSANAPGIAAQVLREVLDDLNGRDNRLELPSTLIRALGTTRYGRWHDTKDNANRYDRTRIAVLAVARMKRPVFWSAQMVERLMPVDL